MANQQPSDLIRLTGLWRHESKSGTVYWSGSLGQAKLILFENTNKRSDRDPDLTMHVAPRPPKEDQGEPSQQQTLPSRPARRPSPTIRDDPPEIDDADIPF